MPLLYLGGSIPNGRSKVDGEFPIGLGFPSMRFYPRLHKATLFVRRLSRQHLAVECEYCVLS